MKTIAKVLLLAVLLVGFVSCKKDGVGRMGQMDVSMTEKESGGAATPPEFMEVNIEVRGVEVHHEGMGWINLPVKVAVHDLLELQSDVTAVLADDVMVPVGEISQMRLILGSNNTLVLAGGVVVPLEVPSGAESGLKINIHQDIRSNDPLEIILDFDAGASVVSNGKGEFHLKPVIGVKSVQ